MVGNEFINGVEEHTDTEGANLLLVWISLSYTK